MESTSKKIRFTICALLILSLMSPTSASTRSQIDSMVKAIVSSLCGLQTLVYTVLPTLALILFLFAGLAYAAGQVFGAEQRARAQGWAMSLLVGGIIGILIAALAPTLVEIFISMSTGMPSQKVCPQPAPPCVNPPTYGGRPVCGFLDDCTTLLCSCGPCAPKCCPDGSCVHISAGCPL